MSDEATKRSIWRSALKWSARAAFFVVFVVVGLGLAGTAIYKSYRYLEERSLRPLQTTKTLTADASTLKIKASIKMKYLDGRMVFLFDFVGYPEPFSREKNQSKSLILDFADDEGFQITHVPIELRKITNIVDENGAPVGGRYQYSEGMKSDEYIRIKDLSISYNIDMSEQAAPPPLLKRENPPTPKPVPAPKREPTNDPCAPGLSKTERLTILQQHGRIRETGSNTYVAGPYTVMFGYNGGVIYCQ